MIRKWGVCVWPLLMGLLPSSAAAQECRWTWEPIGADGEVKAMIVFDDGSGPALYVGGYFGTIGGVYSPFLAKFDGRTWSSVGGGVDDTVSAFGIHDDGTGPALYVGGRIKKAGGVTVSHVARWDGKAWSAVGDGIKDAEDTVLCLASLPSPEGNTLYAGGYFRYAGGKLVQYIAQLTDGHWTDMKGGLWGGPNALAAFDDGTGMALYVGGEFSKAGGKPISGLARWNGSEWTSLGLEPSWASVSCLLVCHDGLGTSLYVSGGWEKINGQDVGRPARWDGRVWSALDDARLSVFAAASADHGSERAFYAAGYFDQIGDAPAHNFAVWDGTSWTAIIPGVELYVWTMAAHDFDGTGPRVFVGGSFDTAGGLYSPNLAMVRCVPICIADCDASGAIDLADFACFQSSFAAGDLKVDCDHTGELDFFDFLCFLNAFNAGC